MDLLIFLFGFTILFFISLVTVYGLAKLLFPKIKDDESDMYYPLADSKYLPKLNRPKQ